MSKSRAVTTAARARERIAAIRAEITACDFVSSGSLTRRMTRCGKAGCRCARDAKWRHGPYFEWGRMEGGRQVSTYVSEAEAAQLREAMQHYRRIKRLLRRWERESIRAMRAEIALSADSRRT
ncbi:MAG: DUF6788 family protein [Thermoanaerobaculales bacterium]